MKKTTMILGAVSVALALACGGAGEEATTEAVEMEPAAAEPAAEEPAAAEPAEEAEAPAEQRNNNTPTPPRKGGKGKMKGKSGR